MNKNNQAVMIGEIRVEIVIGIDIENKGQIIITNNGSMISLIVIPIITRIDRKLEVRPSIIDVYE